ncbi:MAG: arginase family protein [Desulfobacterales bacterium]|nr:arginase family protein [Desulfobacterales bacterium]
MSTNAQETDQSKVMEALYWWGIPTLFRCPNDTGLDDCDIALVGVPHSSGNGTTERDQHLGPRAVRDMSAYARRVHGQFEFSPWDTCRIKDVGDVALPEAMDNEKCIERITDYFKKLDAAGIPPVSIGGDHAITGGILQGIAGKDSVLTSGQKAALLHFDAHTDTFHNLDHFMGAKKSAAHWGSYLVRQGQVDASKSVQIGIRGNPRTTDWLAPSYELGYEVITKARFDEEGIDASIDLINDRIGDAPLYVTFDLDCLDPTIAPGVSNLEPGCEGFKVDQVMKILRSLRGKNIIGGDVVCIMPTKDYPNKITAQVAAAVMFEMICLIADKKRAFT